MENSQQNQVDWALYRREKEAHEERKNSLFHLKALSERLNEEICLREAVELLDELVREASRMADQLRNRLAEEKMRALDEAKRLASEKVDLLPLNPEPIRPSGPEFEIVNLFVPEHMKRCPECESANIPCFCPRQFHGFAGAP